MMQRKYKACLKGSKFKKKYILPNYIGFYPLRKNPIKYMRYENIDSQCLDRKDKGLLMLRLVAPLLTQLNQIIDELRASTSGCNNKGTQTTRFCIN